MALSGSFNDLPVSWFGLKCTWSGTQSIAGNYTDITLSVTMMHNGMYMSATKVNIYIDGEHVDDLSIPSMSGNNADTAGTFTKRVYHDSDGSKSLYMEVNWPYSVSTNSAGTIANLSARTTVTLDPIPRTSSFAATDAAIGSVSTITIYRESTNLYHRIKVEFGSVTGYVTNTGGFSTSASTITGASVAFTIPNDFYYAIPNATKGTCKMTLYTLSGSTIIGDEVTTEIQITTVSDRCNPTVSISVAHDNSSTAALTGSNTAYIRGYSNAKCTVTATGRFGATIKSISANSTFVDNKDGTYTITPVNTDTITFTAKDSRGYSGSASVSLTLVPYIVLTNNASAGRPKPTDGSAFIQFQGQYFNDSFGVTRNTLEIKYKIEYPDGSIDPNWTTVTPTLYEDSYSAYISLSGFDYTKSFKIHTVVTDKLLTLEKTVVLKQGIPVFDWGRNDFQFHVPVYIQGNLVSVPEVLFTSADYPGSSGDITLSQDVSNFEYIEIFFVDNNGRGSNSVKVYNPEGKQICLFAVEPSSSSAFYIRRSDYTVSGNKITYGGKGGYVYFNGSSWSPTSGNLIRITRVVGHNRTTVAHTSAMYAALAAAAAAETPAEETPAEQPAIPMEDDSIPEETFPEP